MDTTNPLSSLIAAMRLHVLKYAPLEGDLAQEVKAVQALLDGVLELGDMSRPSAHGVTDHLDATLALVDQQESLLGAALRPLAPYLPWRYSYEPRDDAAGLENNMAWAELIGPIAPRVSRKVCFGLTLIGPHTTYPLHHHPAVEVYSVVVGNATWTLEGQSTIHPPGTVILHPRNALHAMKTHDEPLLAIYSWTGDIDTLSVYD